MAKASFLTESESKQANRVLKPPSRWPNGNENIETQFYWQPFSIWLGEKLKSKLEADPNWEKAGPIALGSWARGELAPNSDFDLLFCGDEEAVKPLVKLIQESGLRIRCRMPEDPNDWTKGVEAFDVLALTQARPFSAGAGEKLKIQQNIIFERGSVVKNEILKAIVKERKDRAKRYDSISNFLEPNIKYGAGGLRDLQQGYYVLGLFSGRFMEVEHTIKVLDYYKSFFLNLRQKLHLIGGSDVILAHYQEELSTWMGFPSRREFMCQIELGISRVNFYSDWIVESARARKQVVEKANRVKISSLAQALTALEENPTVLMQHRVRGRLSKILPDKKPRDLEQKKISGQLYKFLEIEKSEEFFRSLFRSRLIDRCIPEINKIIGLVQHDQYHRFSVDAHILQALRVLRRTYKKPRTLPGIGPLLKKMSGKDWKILIWTCIYHDIAKGGNTEHSIAGAKLVSRDFKKWNFPTWLEEEVGWLVKNHLLMSTSAFRKNIRSPETWKEMHALGSVGERLRRLAVFTAVDIAATNPEAWNIWKARLIMDLVSVMNKEQTAHYLSFLGQAVKLNIIISAQYLQKVDPALIAALPSRLLLEDYVALQKTSGDLKPKIWKDARRGNNFYWVRLHRRKDKTGIFLSFVETLYGIGCSITQTYAQTYKKYGAYDWFQIKTSKSTAQLKKLFELKLESKEIPYIKFEQIELVTISDKEAVISFKGVDRSGALVSAVRALTLEHLPIRWARVLTWGRQIDDVFGVSLLKDKELFQEKLKRIQTAFLEKT